MSNLVPFAQSAVPAFFAGAFAAEDTNIVTATPTPALSFRGKTWRIAMDGQETIITNKDGDPSAMVSVVILDQVKRRSRAFYEGEYVSGENKAPRCSSIDGVTPDADIAEPISPKCASCPNSVKGSKISASGKAVMACSSVKRLAVVPASQPKFSGLLLRLPQTSLWDKDNKENEAKGWYAWDQYMEFLKARGVTHTAQVVTKMKFDARTEYPKLLFTADRWVTPEEWAILSERWKSDEVKDLLLGKSNAMETDDGQDAPAPAAQQAAQAAQVAQPAAAAAQPAAAAAPTRTRKPREAAQPAPAAQPAAATAQPAASNLGGGDDDDEEDGGNFGAPGAQAQPAQAAQPAAAAPAATAQAPAATANAGLSALLGSWDD